MDGNRMDLGQYFLILVMLAFFSEMAIFASKSKAPRAKLSLDKQHFIIDRNVTLLLCYNRRSCGEEVIPVAKLS